MGRLAPGILLDLAPGIPQGGIVRPLRGISIDQTGQSVHHLSMEPLAVQKLPLLKRGCVTDRKAAQERALVQGHCLRKLLETVIGRISVVARHYGGGLHFLPPVRPPSQQGVELADIHPGPVVSAELDRGAGGLQIG